MTQNDTATLAQAVHDRYDARLIAHVKGLFNARLFISDKNTKKSSSDGLTIDLDGNRT